MNWIQWTSMYFLVGIVYLAMMDWTHSKIVKFLGKGEPFTNSERLVLFIFWPFFGFVFFYNFWKAWFNRDK